MKIVFQESWLSYHSDCNFNYITTYRKELVARIVSQGVAAFAPPLGESEFGHMAKDGNNPFESVGSCPL